MDQARRQLTVKLSMTVKMRKFALRRAYLELKSVKQVEDFYETSWDVQNMVR